MEENEKWKLLSIVLAFFFLSSLVIIFDLGTNDRYIKETDLIANEFATLELDTPQWNETTRYFEVWNGTTVHIGYTRFNDMDTNLLEVVRFDGCEVINLAGRYQYTATGDNTTIIVSREVKRRFLDNE